MDEPSVGMGVPYAGESYFKFNHSHSFNFGHQEEKQNIIHLFAEDIPHPSDGPVVLEDSRVAVGDDVCYDALFQLPTEDILL